MGNDDSRFTYVGEGLGPWLWRLVDEDPSVRARAGQAVMQMYGGVPLEALDEVGCETYVEEFNARVRQTVAAPGFDTAIFVRRLCRTYMLSWQEHHAKFMAKMRREKPFGCLGLLVWALELPFFAVKRAARGDFVIEPTREEKGIASYDTAAICVLHALDTALLSDTESLMEMLESPFKFVAADAIARIGPPAGAFTDYFLRRLDEGKPGHPHAYPFSMSQPLAGIARSDAKLIGAITERLASEKPHVVQGAADTLHHLRANAAETHPESVAALLAASCHVDYGARASAARALGRVTAGSDAAVDRLLEMTRDPIPDVRASALMALGELGRQPERVVPRLVEALDDRVDLDPTDEYTDHETVSMVLATFGHAAAPAVPAVIARVRMEDGDPDLGLIGALGAIGPAAAEALPVLEDLLREETRDCGDHEQSEPAYAIEWAIARIRGVPPDD